MECRSCRHSSALQNTLYVLLDLADHLQQELRAYAREHAEHARTVDRARDYVLQVREAMRTLWQAYTPMNPQQQQPAPRE